VLKQVFDPQEEGGVRQLEGSVAPDPGDRGLAVLHAGACIPVEPQTAGNVLALGQLPDLQPVEAVQVAQSRVLQFHLLSESGRIRHRVAGLRPTRDCTCVGALVLQWKRHTRLLQCR